MKRVRFLLFFLFLLIANSVLFAQDGKTVIIHLKTGYSVKGVIVEQTDQHVKIKTAGGDIFDYKTDELETGRIEEVKVGKTASGETASAKTSIPVINKSGDKIIGVALGFGGMVGYENAEKFTFPPIPLSFEYVVMDNLFNGRGAIGVGGFLGYSATKSSYDYKYSKLFIGARGYIHYAFVEKLDTYGGIFLGFKNDAVSNSSYSNANSSEGSAAISVFAGCRYYFTDKFAVSAELGWGLSIFNIGAAYKF
jgi:hypothetical protein